MKRSSLRGALVVLAGAWVLLGQLVGPTSASLNARATNEDNVFSTGSLGAPSNLTAVAVGRSVDLDWSAGSGGNSYAVRRAAAVGGSCTSANPTQVATPTPATYLDSFYQPQGTMFCYEVATRESSWTSVNGNPRIGVRVGFFVETVTFASGGNSGNLSPGDTITITFNQPVAPLSGPLAAATVCTTQGNGTSGVLVVGSATSTGNCATSEGVSLGAVAGIATSRNARFAANNTWSADFKTLTITVGSRTVGNGNPSVSGTGLLYLTTSATQVLSATGSYHVCDTNSGGGDCLRAVSGSL